MVTVAEEKGLWGGPSGTGKCSSQKVTHFPSPPNTLARASHTRPGKAGWATLQKGKCPGGEELEVLETGSDDYHIYDNLRIPGLIRGSNLKTDRILSVPDMGPCFWLCQGIMLGRLEISRLVFRSFLAGSPKVEKGYLMKRLL